MTDTPDPAANAQGNAQRDLDRVTEQVEAMQALLVRLLQDVVRAESRLGHVSAAPTLVDVNQQLVVAAMSSQAEAEAAQRALQAAAQAAMLDALTGLPNRNALRDRFTRAAAQARRHGGRCALLFIDLDDFKQLNDAHGHDFGDRVLKLVAERLGAAVREVDTVSRHGGDEFLVLLGELTHREDAQPVADKLAAAIAESFDVAGHGFGVTASIGIAIFPDDGEDIDTLIAHADAAMYANKRQRQGMTTTPVAGAVRQLQRPDTAEGHPHPHPNPHQRLADLRDANEKLVMAALDARRLAEAAEQARERQTALLAAVVHELRDPMAPIRIATTMLGRPSADEPLVPRVQQIVAQQLQQISTLVDAVRSVDGEAAPTGLRLQREQVEMGDVIDAAVAAMRPLTDASDLQVDWQRPTEPVVLVGDVAGLEQLVVNLLDNASRHTRTGGRIGVRLAQGDGHLRLAVSDDGVGITPSLLPIIFEPFVQDIRTLGADGIGLGVGLTVARALAQALGGNIVAHSDGHERGSEFVLTLPLADAGDAADAPELAETPGTASAQEPT